MADVKEALTHWLRILKEEGYLYVVVPDWELYEKRRWPSVFNADHKASFSLSVKLERPDHYYVPDLARWLDWQGCSVLAAYLETDHYDPAKGDDIDQTQMRYGGALCQVCFIGRKRCSTTR